MNALLTFCPLVRSPVLTSVSLAVFHVPSTDGGLTRPWWVVSSPSCMLERPGNFLKMLMSRCLPRTPHIRFPRAEIWTSGVFPGCCPTPACLGAEKTALASALCPDLTRGVQGPRINRRTWLLLQDAHLKSHPPLPFLVGVRFLGLL